MYFGGLEVVSHVYATFTSVSGRYTKPKTRRDTSYTHRIIKDSYDDMSTTVIQYRRRTVAEQLAYYQNQIEQCGGNEKVVSA